MGYHCTGNENLYCSDCGFWFNNKNCMDYHKSTKTGQRRHKSLCKERYFCTNCDRVIQNRGNAKKHQCETTFTTEDKTCHRCKEEHEEGNKYCYIQPVPHAGEIYAA